MICMLSFFYKGHFLLTELLIDKFQRGSRIIFLSSAAHKLSKELDLTILLESYKKATTTSDRLLSYANSKLCLLLYAKTLAKHMKGKMFILTVVILFNNQWEIFLQIKKSVCFQLILVQ